jgi:hypothetical protein
MCGYGAPPPDADIAKGQEGLEHATMTTTRRYDRRPSRPEESLTFQVED